MAKCPPKISATSWTEYQKVRRAKLIVSLVSLNGCGESLRADAERIQREIEEYRTLSQRVIQMTNTVSESVEKVRATVAQEKE